MKKRLDILLFQFGLCRSRSEAVDLISRGLVFYNEKQLIKASSFFEESLFANIAKTGQMQIRTKQYVSRGAYKLLAAKEFFKLDFKNKIALDIGSSTGGFTEVLCENEAKIVYAVDIGTNQFNQKLLEKYNSKIKLFEKTDIRNVNISDFNLEKAYFDLIVCDVSFISVKEIVEVLPKFADANTDIILLLKPQFEIGKVRNFTGVVRDEKQRIQIVNDIFAFLNIQNFEILNYKESPVLGGDGNVEFLLYIKQNI